MVLKWRTKNGEPTDKILEDRKYRKRRTDFQEVEKGKDKGRQFV